MFVFSASLFLADLSRRVVSLRIFYFFFVLFVTANLFVSSSPIGLSSLPIGVVFVSHGEALPCSSSSSSRRVSSYEMTCACYAFVGGGLTNCSTAPYAFVGGGN